MIFVPPFHLAVPFLLFLGLMALPPGRPAKIGIGIGGFLVLWIAAHALTDQSPISVPMAMLGLGGPVALAAAGQVLLSRQGTRRGPLIVTGLCLLAALLLTPILLWAT